MRAVWWRELRELRVPALAVFVAMALLGAEFARDGIRENCLAIPGLIGGGFGLFQGLLDRARRGDGFLLHRPGSALRIHLARSFAGFTILSVGVAAAGAGGAWWHWRESVRAREYGDFPRGVFAIPHSRRFSFTGQLEFGAGSAALVLALLVGGYVVVRLSAARRRTPVGICVAGALAIAGWSLVARCPNPGIAAAASTVFSGVVFALLLLDLVGDRR